MPIPFEQFRLLNEGTKKKVENVSYARPLRVRVDDLPEFEVPLGQVVEIPDGLVIEISAEEVPD